MQSIFFTIITVTYNNIYGLEKTIKSVKEQKFKNYEHVIIDGASTDGSLFLLEKLDKNKNIRYLSEPDNGIFNAMNKGICLSKGKWVIFMNAGDVFCSKDTLVQLYSTGFFQNDDLKLIYGDKMDCHHQVIKARSSMECLFYGEMPACHQSIFFRNDIKYDETFRIFGDIDLLSRLYILGVKYKYVELPICIYEGGGISSKISWLKRREKIRSLYLNFGFKAVYKNYLVNAIFYKKLFCNLGFHFFNK